jgi:hypothetical protein
MSTARTGHAGIGTGGPIQPLAAVAGSVIAG